jgi:predicted TIM-barrel fold metal-dependent hydrolase
MAHNPSLREDAMTKVPSYFAETNYTMAKRPNVAVKASALPSYSSEPYPYRGLHAHIRRVYDAFGPQQMFWGTDFTRLSRARTARPSRCSPKSCRGFRRVTRS